MSKHDKTTDIIDKSVQQRLLERLRQDLDGDVQRDLRSHREAIASESGERRSPPLTLPMEEDSRVAAAIQAFDHTAKSLQGEKPGARKLTPEEEARRERSFRDTLQQLDPKTRELLQQYLGDD